MCVQKLVRWNKDRTGYESVESGHRGHEWAELFFDLIFVAALVKLSALLKHGPSGPGLPAGK